MARPARDEILYGLDVADAISVDDPADVADAFSDLGLEMIGRKPVQPKSSGARVAVALDRRRGVVLGAVRGSGFRIWASSGRSPSIPRKALRTTAPWSGSRWRSSRPAT